MTNSENVKTVFAAAHNSNFALARGVPTAGWQHSNVTDDLTFCVCVCVAYGEDAMSKPSEISGTPVNAIYPAGYKMTSSFART